MPHYISPPSECLLAEICNHTWNQECGKAKSQSDYVIFSDNCQRHEYNCDNNKDYTKVEMSECDRSLTSDSTTITMIMPIDTTPSTTIPPTECVIADSCNHNWIPECGKEKSQLDNHLFSDECSRHEYNCDNKKDYSRVEMSECETNSTMATTTEDTTTTNKATTTTNEATTTTPTTTTVSTTTTPTTTTTTNTTTESTTTTAAMTTTATPTTTTTTMTNTTSKPSVATVPTFVIHNCTRKPSTVTNGYCSSSTVATTTMYNEITTTTIISTTTDTSITTVTSTTTEAPTTTKPPTTTKATNTTTESSTTTESPINTEIETAEQVKDELTTLTEYVALTERTVAVKIATAAATETTEQITNINENTIPQNADTTKAVASLTCEPKDCDLPHTWETTAKGEKRDFFQILRERYGSRVKLLRATTHWPRRAAGTNVYGNSFILGRRHVESVNINLI